MPKTSKVEKYVDTVRRFFPLSLFQCNGIVVLCFVPFIDTIDVGFAGTFGFGTGNRIGVGSPHAPQESEAGHRRTAPGFPRSLSVPVHHRQHLGHQRMARRHRISPGIQRNVIIEVKLIMMLLCLFLLIELVYRQFQLVSDGCETARQPDEARTGKAVGHHTESAPGFHRSRDHLLADA